MRPADQQPSDLDQPMEGPNRDATPADEAVASVEVEPTTAPVQPQPSQAMPRAAEETAAPAPGTPVQPVAPSSSLDNTPASTTPTPVVAPMPSPMPPPPAGIAPKKGKKKFVIAGVVAGIIALIGGGGAYAYFGWYQNPDKVILDSLMNIGKTKQAGVIGSVAITNEAVNISVDLSTKGNEEISSLKADVKIKGGSTGILAGQELTVTTDAVTVKEGDIYFRVSKLQKAIDSFVDSYVDSYADQYSSFGYAPTEAEKAQMRNQAKSQFSGVVSKIDDQWIKVSADDLKKDQDSESTCTTNLLEKVSKDRKLASEVLDVYRQHRFLTVKEKLASQDGSFGYLLDLDKAAAKEFVKGVEGTEFGKELIKCNSDAFKDSSDTMFDDSGEGVKNGRFELWVDQWSHRITRVVASGESPDSVTSEVKLSADFKFDYKVTVDDVKVPDGAKSIKEIQDDIQAAIGSTGVFSSTSET